MRKILLLLLLCSISSMAQETTRKMIETAPDKNNQKVIKKYNRFNYRSFTNYSYSGILPSTKCPYTAIFGVDTNSTMSNDDIEVNFIKKWVPNPLYSDEEDRVYFVEIENKTDNPIYIDKGYCYKVLNDGSQKFYYDLKQQTDSSKTERYIAIPPHSKRNLSDYRWAMSKNGNYPEILEYPEDFDWSAAEAGISKDFLVGGDEVRYTENSSPYHMSFVINYSKEEDFSTYSMVKINFYIRQLIGTYYPELVKINSADFRMRDVDEYTITSCDVLF